VLEAMISNLLKNGAEAIEAHAHDRAAIASLLTAPTPEPAIRVQVSADGATARIEVIDNGRSIADTNLDRLFDTYVASKPAETETGLGLAIVREIVSRHHGKIWAEIIPSGGTRFVVELPIAERARGREVDALSDIRALTPRE
jgi:signal transduction histidine kinase